MKYQFFRALLFFSIYWISPLSAQLDTTIEFRTAAFFPTDNLFRHIYGTAGPSFQFEGAYRFCGCYQGWINLDLFTKTGHVKHCGKTTIDIYNMSFGPKYLYPIYNCVDAYGGIGLSLARVHINNHSCGNGKESKLGVGGILKSGINIYLDYNLVLDVFCDYLFQRARFRQNVDVGGFKLGAGIGVRF